MSILWLIVAALVWGAFHSLTASLGFKAWLTRAFGTGFGRVYRFIYNVVSLLTFLPLLWLVASLPSRLLYAIPAPWAYLTGLGQLLGLALLVAGVLQTDPLAFVGLRGLFDPNPPEAKLVTHGPYRYVRHPLYTGGLLFLWLTPVMTDTLLTFYASLTVYMIIGALFEERKLLREFGQPYADYRARTPFLIPWPRGNNSRRAAS